MLFTSSANVPKQEVVIGGTFATDFLEAPLRVWAGAIGMSLNVRWVPYGTTFDALDRKDSLFNENIEGCNILLVRATDLCLECHPEERMEVFLAHPSCIVFFGLFCEACPRRNFVVPIISSGIRSYLGFNREEESWKTTRRYKGRTVQKRFCQTGASSSNVQPTLQVPYARAVASTSTLRVRRFSV